VPYRSSSGRCPEFFDLVSNTNTHAARTRTGTHEGRHPYRLVWEQISEDTLASFVADECMLGHDWWCKISDFRERYERHSESISQPVTR
jgi:hypothetical protein